VKSFQELVEYGKTHPGKLNFASAGIGTTPHLAGELFKMGTGVDATHIPYKGIGASFTDIMAGKVQFAFSSIAGALPFTADNRVRAIATTGPKRSSTYPDLPTVAESGLPGFEVDLWLGIFVPSATPVAIVTRLNTELKKALNNSETKAALAKVGVEPRGTTLEDGPEFVHREFEQWQKVIAEAKIKPE
jgi:tripartite-type tricarboxylate transporter receptor subunit TctC